MNRLFATIASVAAVFALCALGVAAVAGTPSDFLAVRLAPSPSVSVTTLPQLPTMAPVVPTTVPLNTEPPVSGAGGSIVAPPGTVIQITGDVGFPKVVTLKDLQLMRHSSLTMRVTDPDGKARLHIFTGVLLRDLVTSVAPTAPGGASSSTTAYALVEGVNGEAAIIGFPEFETAFNNKRILIAYEIDGAPLAGQNIGELVVPEDQSSGRFIIGVTTIRISTVTP